MTTLFLLLYYTDVAGFSGAGGDAFLVVRIGTRPRTSWRAGWSTAP